MSVQYRPVAGDSRKRGLVLCIAGALVMCGGVLVWSFNRVTLAEEAIVQPIPSDPDALPDEEEEHTGDYDEMLEKFYQNPEKEPIPIFIGFPCAKDSSWSERYPGKSNAVI